MDSSTTTKLLYATGFAAAMAFALYYKKRRGESDDHSIEIDRTPFMLNLTQAAKDGKIQKVVGMDDVASRLIHVLSRRNKSNPLLIGEPGVGKTAAVELLSQKIVSGNVPKSLRGVSVFALNLGELMAGTKYRGDLEKRLQSLLDNLEHSADKKNILFIDEIQMIEQARGTEGGLDLADIIKPALSRGQLRVIGATTWDEYKEFLKPDSAVERRFQPVLVNEPSVEDTIKILKGVKDEYEKHHGVKIPDDTVRAAVESAYSYIHNRHMPDKALDVIDESCAKVSIEHANGGSNSGGEPTVTPADVASIVKQWTEFNKSGEESAK